MRALFFFVFVLFVGSSAHAQARPELYWVVESNKYQRDYSIVRLYDVEHNLVYEVKLDKRINIAKKRDRSKLDRLVSEYTNRYVANRKRTKFKSSI